MLKTYFEEADADAAATVIKELKPPKKYLNELVAYVMLESLDKGDNDRDNISKLISAMKKEGVITGEHFMEVSTVNVVLQYRFQLRELYVNELVKVGCPTKWYLIRIHFAICNA